MDWTEGAWGSCRFTLGSDLGRSVEWGGLLTVAVVVWGGLLTVAVVVVAALSHRLTNVKGGAADLHCCCGCGCIPEGGALATTAGRLIVVGAFS